MQTVKKSSYKDVAVGEIFIMFDIVMIKIDNVASVALGHIDFIKFNQDYFDSLIDRGLLPHIVDYNTPVDIVCFNGTDYIGDEYVIKNVKSTGAQYYKGIFLFNGKPCIRVYDEPGLTTYLAIEEIVNIENEADYGVLDSPQTFFVRDDSVYIDTVLLEKV